MLIGTILYVPQSACIINQQVPLRLPTTGTPPHRVVDGLQGLRESYRICRIQV